mmetsp:Transcript_33725/g.61767  ORF Transcript_33725/g.61767 Transcript_33725/m.61767 type:complete len:439 (-) Transcript_33725:14-1330(-)
MGQGSQSRPVSEANCCKGEWSETVPPCVYGTSRSSPLAASIEQVQARQDGEARSGYQPQLAPVAENATQGFQEDAIQSSSEPTKELSSTEPNRELSQPQLRPSASVGVLPLDTPSLSLPQSGSNDDMWASERLAVSQYSARSGADGDNSRIGKGRGRLKRADSRVKDPMERSGDLSQSWAADILESQESSRSGTTSMSSDEEEVVVEFEPGNFEFEVELKEEEGSYGVEVLCPTEDLIIVTRIHDNGPVADWNQANPEKCICVGDAILAMEETTDMVDVARVVSGEAGAQRPSASGRLRKFTMRHAAFDLDLAISYEDPKLKLGLKFEGIDKGRLLAVNNIDEGLVTNWNINADQYDLSLRVGDLILAVNGVTGNTAKMIEAAKSAKAWTFKVVHVNKSFYFLGLRERTDLPQLQECCSGELSSVLGNATGSPAVVPN